MSYKIYVPRSVYLDSGITNQELITYCVLYTYAKNSVVDFELVTIESLLWRMYGKYEVSRKVRQNVIDAVEGLIVKKIISCEHPNNGIFILRSDQFAHTNQFAQIDYDVMRSIMDLEYKNKHQLFRYYCVMMGSRNGVASNMKVEYFAKLLNVSEKTILSYNKILEDEKIIYILRASSLKESSDGGIYRDNNLYCAYEDRLELFNAKSMGQKIFRIKSGIKYPAAEMKQISDYIKAHNESEYIKKKKNPDYVPNILTNLDA